jgi:aryl-alcohol dehydrogenase-like predicted oxidoreductase
MGPRPPRPLGAGTRDHRGLALIERRALGATGIEVGAIGLGAWQLGGNDVWNGPGEEESLAIVEAALAAGCTLFDSAPGYAEGRSEAVLGRALAGRRDEVVLCTKFGHTADGRTDFSVEALRPSLEESLARLSTSHVDLLLLHNPPDPLLEPGAPIWAELERLRAEGLVRAYGASVDWAADVDAAVAAGAQVLEVLLNAFHQEPLPALERARSAGVGTIVKVPLDSGWLGGRYRAGASFDGVRGRWSEAVIARRAALVERFEALLPDGVSTAHGALAFLLAQEPVASVIPGAKSVAQLEANAAAADVSLPADAVAAIEALWRDEIADDPLPW